MKLGVRIGLICCFFAALIGLVWAGSMTAYDHSVKPVNATEDASAKKSDANQPTQRPTRPPEPTAKAAPSQFSSKKLESIEKKVDAELNEMDFNGTFLIAVGDETIYHKAMGYSDTDKKEKNTLNTKYEIGSCTKQFTATAVAKLAQEGKLSLKDKFTKYVKEIKTGKNITIEQLMNMCSGLPDYLNEYIYSVESGERDEDSKLSKEEFIEWINDRDTIFDPGECFSYCNSNYYILGLIIEEVTGESYEQYIHDEILYPLYMDDTSLNMLDTSCNGYLDSDFTEGIKLDSSYFYSAGEIVSTTTDMLKWINAYKSGRVLNKQMLSKATHAGSDGFNYGFGWFVTNDYAYHTGNTELFYAVDIFSKKNDIKIIGLSNVNDTTLQQVGLHIFSIVKSELYPKKPTEPTEPTEPANPTDKSIKSNEPSEQ